MHGCLRKKALANRTGSSEIASVETMTLHHIRIVEGMAPGFKTPGLENYLSWKLGLY
jgi:hypothetical protein